MDAYQLYLRSQGMPFPSNSRNESIVSEFSKTDPKGSSMQFQGTYFIAKNEVTFNK